MKLRTIAVFTSALALAALSPACGDDGETTGNSDDDVEEDAGGGEPEPNPEPEPEATDEPTDEPEPAATEPEPTATTEPNPEPEPTETVEPEPTTTTDTGVEPEPTTSTETAPETDTETLVEPESMTPAPDGGEPEPPACEEPVVEAPVEPDCPAPADRTAVEVEGEIDADTEWTCDNVYYLTNLTYVVGGASLTIQAGTEVLGDNGSALVITRGSQIFAEGTAQNPIVFSSSLAPGDRAPADWGGVVLLGDAPINIAGGENPVEGIDPTLDNGVYGGTDPTSDCGILRYARIEFAGFLFGVDNELNGLTVGGCGSDTELEYIQVHNGADDGIEMFGGSADLKHVFVSSEEDDGIDWDQGWTGRVQYAVVQHDPAGADSGFEADNQEDDFEAMPRSNPTIYNFTLIGGGVNGVILRRGTWGTLRNGIVMNFPGAGLDVRDEASAAGTLEDPPALVVENSIFWGNGEDFASDSAADNDALFDEEAYFTAAERANQQIDPELGDPENLTAPDFVPTAESPAASGAATPPDDGFFNVCSTYIGAFEPAGEDWTAGWTAFPAN